MQVFNHHVYEYKKGLRNLILYTSKKIDQDDIIEKLTIDNISYLIYSVNEDIINIFFGNDSCIEVIRLIGKNSLNDYTPDEDFILGIMLGYDRVLQCKRYIKRIHFNKKEKLIG